MAFHYSAIGVLILIAAVNNSYSAIDIVGSINGKTFFADPNEPVSNLTLTSCLLTFLMACLLAQVQAATAATRCHENNGTLARIESYDEGRVVLQYMFANDGI